VFGIISGDAFAAITGLANVARYSQG
jgi:hypothetical protein